MEQLGHVETMEVEEEGAIDLGDAAFDVQDLAFASDAESEEDDGSDNGSEDDSDSDDKHSEEAERLIRGSDGEVIFRASNQSKISRKRKRKNDRVDDEERKRKKYRPAREIAKEKKGAKVRKNAKFYAVHPDFKNDHLSASLERTSFILKLSFNIS